VLIAQTQNLGVVIIIVIISRGNYFTLTDSNDENTRKNMLICVIVLFSLIFYIITVQFKLFIFLHALLQTMISRGFISR
jgi:dipeptide/tripeptide permease